MIQLHKRKQILNRTRARNRTCVGSAQNLLNIMRSRSATTGRAMFVRYDCVLCTKSWIAHSARCALRLHHVSRWLFNHRSKERQPTVIFTASPDAPYSSYTPESTPYKDEKLAISFETEEMMQESLVLLRFNCPDSSCEYVATGWNDLKLHVRGIHKKFMWYVPICPLLSVLV